MPFLYLVKLEQFITNRYNMSGKETYVNFWSLLEAYDPKKYDIVIEKVRGEDKLKIAVYRKWVYNFLGFKISKQRLKVEWVINVDVDKNIFDHVVNSSFKDDFAVNCSTYMRYTEQGFNENRINILDVLKGSQIPEKAHIFLEGFNYRLDLLHCAIGMMSEAGEILDHIKKYVYHDKPFAKNEIASEFGDFEWYKFNALRLLGISFSDTLKANKIKLDARYPNGRSKNYLAQAKAKNTDQENDLIQKELYNKEK